MKPKVRTKLISCSSVSRKTRTACTNVSTATLATMVAGTLKMGSRGLAADCSVNIAPDVCRDRLRLEQAIAAAERRFQPKNKREDQGSSLLQPARMRNRRRVRA